MSSFRSSEKWRPQNNTFYKEWKDFKEKKRIEQELIARHESLLLRMVRTLFGYSPLRGKLAESRANADEVVTHM